MTVTSRRRRARRRAVRTSLNMLSGFAAGGWSALVGLVVLPFYLKYLGIEAFGLVGFLLTLQAWFLLLDMGLSPTTSREMARFSGGQHSQQGIRNLFTSLEWVYALIAVFLALTLVAGARWLVSDWLQLKSLRPEVAAAALSLMAAMVAIQWMAMLYRSAINGLQRQVWLGGLTIALSSLRALASVAVLAWISPTLNAFVLAQSACYLMEAAVMRWYLGRRLPVARGRFSMAALKAVWQFAAGISAITVLATLLNQIDKLLLAKLLNLEEFGYFSLSMSVIGTLSIIVSPLFNAAYPRLTELAASGQNKVLSAEYHAFSQIAAFTILPIAATLAVFSSQAVYAWTGDRKLTGLCVADHLCLGRRRSIEWAPARALRASTCSWLGASLCCAQRVGGGHHVSGATLAGSKVRCSCRRVDMGLCQLFSLHGGYFPYASQASERRSSSVVLQRSRCAMCCHSGCRNSVLGCSVRNGAAGKVPIRRLGC
jgi:O-antigen/teichoic acid export membrane protein